MAVYNLEVVLQSNQFEENPADFHECGTISGSINRPQYFYATETGPIKAYLSTGTTYPDQRSVVVVDYCPRADMVQIVAKTGVAQVLRVQHPGTDAFCTLITLNHGRFDFSFDLINPEPAENFIYRTQISGDNQNP